MKKTQEALIRMSMWGLPELVKTAYSNFGLITMSEPGEVPTTIEYDSELFYKIREIENEYDINVYYVICQLTNIGELYTMLYVSDEEDEWEMDRDDIKNNSSVCYVLNVTYPDCSEFGTCGIEPIGRWFKELKRTW